MVSGKKKRPSKSKKVVKKRVPFDTLTLQKVNSNSLFSNFQGNHLVTQRAFLLSFHKELLSKK